MNKLLWPIIAFLVVPLSASTQIQPAWYSLGSNQQGDSLYINDSSRTKESAWFLIWSNKIAAGRGSYTLIKQAFNCKTKRIGIKEYAIYDISGAAISGRTFENDFEDKEPTPGSTGEKLFFAACDIIDFKKEEDGEAVKPLSSINEIIDFMAMLENTRQVTAPRNN